MEAAIEQGHRAGTAAEIPGRVRQPATGRGDRPSDPGRHDERPARGTGLAARRSPTEIDEPLNNVTYHVNQLRELGCIELVHTERRRRPGDRTLLPRQPPRLLRRRRLGGAEREGALRRDLVDDPAVISEDIARAMSAGHLLRRRRRPHHPLSRCPVDAEGWDGSHRAVSAARPARLFEIEERVAGALRGRRRRRHPRQGRDPPVPLAAAASTGRPRDRAALAADRLADDVLDPRRSRAVRFPGLPRDFFSRPQNSACSVSVRLFGSGRGPSGPARG